MKLRTIKYIWAWVCSVSKRNIEEKCVYDIFIVFFCFMLHDNDDDVLKMSVCIPKPYLNLRLDEWSSIKYCLIISFLFARLTTDNNIGIDRIQFWFEEGSDLCLCKDWQIIRKLMWLCCGLSMFVCSGWFSDGFSKRLR